MRPSPAGLDRAVLAERAVQDGQHHVDLAEQAGNLPWRGCGKLLARLPGPGTDWAARLGDILHRRELAAGDGQRPGSSAASTQWPARVDADRE